MLSTEQHDCPLSKETLESMFLKHEKIYKTATLTSLQKTKGLNVYTSDIFFGKASILYDNEKTIEYNFVIKQRPPKLPDTNNLFGKESHAYTHILSDLNELLRSHTGETMTFFPICYYTQCDDTMRVIVLEDGNATGFFVKPYDYTFDEAHVDLLMKRLAKFHALAMALERKEKKGLREVYGEHVEELYVRLRDVLLENYSKGLPSSIELLKKNGVSLEKLAFLDKVVENVIKFWDDTLLEPSQWNVICHGDLWTSNTLWKNDEDGKVVDMKMLDLQVFRVGNMALDLSNFFCICVEPSTLRNHFDAFLKSYHESFVDTLKAVGYDGPVITLEELHQEYVKYGKWGYVCANQWLPLMLTKLERTTNINDDFETTKELDNSVLLKRLQELTDFYHERGLLSF